jgi:hypothetical protein
MMQNNLPRFVQKDWQMRKNHAEDAVIIDNEDSGTTAAGDDNYIDEGAIVNGDPAEEEFV